MTVKTKKVCLAFLLLSAVFFLFSTISFAAVSLAAEPSEVRAGNGFGKTRIFWEADGEAELYLVKEDGSLAQVDGGRAGVYQEYGVYPNQTYEYRLYPAGNLENPLASVTVVGTRQVDYLPDFQTFSQKILKIWAIPLILIFGLLLAARFLARRRKRLKLQKVLITGAVILSIVGAAFVIGRIHAVAFAAQPEPDAQETISAARQLFEGGGYKTDLYKDTSGNLAENSSEKKLLPPRYPPGFAAALLPFQIFGQYPANVIFGAKFYTLFYLALAIFAAWTFGGRMAALLTAILVGVSPFAEAYARIVMSETLTAGLILLILVLLYKPSSKKIIFAGAIAGVLVLIRLQMLVCLPALLLALPTMRDRIRAALSAAPFYLANGIYNWQTFGSFFKTGYDFWLPQIKPFALDYAVRLAPQGDGPFIVNDLLRGWLMIWICPCEKGGVMAAMPNLIFYPLVLIGVFWIFAPPFVTLYGLWQVWKKRRETAAKFVIWLTFLTVLLFTFYFYEAVRFMSAAATALIIFAAVGLGKKLERFIQPDSNDDLIKAS